MHKPRSHAPCATRRLAGLAPCWLLLFSLFLAGLPKMLAPDHAAASAK